MVAFELHYFQIILNWWHSPSSLYSTVKIQIYVRPSPLWHKKGKKSVLVGTYPPEYVCIVSRGVGTVYRVGSTGNDDGSIPRKGAVADYSIVTVAPTVPKNNNRPNVSPPLPPSQNKYKKGLHATYYSHM